MDVLCIKRLIVPVVPVQADVRDRRAVATQQLSIAIHLIWKFSNRAQVSTATEMMYMGTATT